jgi:hypothetical protein
MEPVENPTEYVGTRHPESVWVTDSNHAVVRIRGPHMLGDTVVGDVGKQLVKIPLTDTSKVVVSRPSTGKTIALATAGGAIVVGGLVLMFEHHSSSTAQNTCLTPNDFEDICGGPTH